MHARAPQDKQDRIENMTKLLASIKADMMNRTLYALTLITAVATPVTFLTGMSTTCLWTPSSLPLIFLEPPKWFRCLLLLTSIIKGSSGWHLGLRPRMLLLVLALVALVSIL